MRSKSCHTLFIDAQRQAGEADETVLGAGGRSGLLPPLVIILRSGLAKLRYRRKAADFGRALVAARFTWLWARDSWQAQRRIFISEMDETIS